MERVSRLDDGFVIESPKMPAATQVQIRTLYRQGRSYLQIMQIVGVSRQTVAKYLRPVTRGVPVKGNF